MHHFTWNFCFYYVLFLLVRIA